MKKSFSVLSLVGITFFGCLFGYLIPSIINSKIAHIRAKEVIHINETSAKETPIGVVSRNRVLKRVTQGIASWYGKDFDGKPMANGEPFDKEKATVAHRDFWRFPKGAYLKVTNNDNGRSTIIPLTDRGPFKKKNGVYSRDIDLSEGAARRLDPLYKEKGLLHVSYEIFVT